MKLSTLYGKVKRAVMEYQLISKGDKVAIGISGGKDSLLLLYLLHNLTKSDDLHFSIHPVMVNMGFDGFSPNSTVKFVESLGLKMQVVDTELANIIFNVRNEKNPCALCSKMRRGILNKTIKSLGCNKLALGHHRDDIISTYLLSLLYEGRFHSMEPKSYMDKSDIHLIRPLLYIEEVEVVSAVKKLHLPVVQSPCPVDKTSKRKEVEHLLNDIASNIPTAREKIFTALKKKNFHI